MQYIIRPSCLLTALWAGLLLVSCRGSGEAPSPYRQLTFTVDSSRLGEEVSVAGIAFQAPRGWERADSAAMVRIREAAAQDTGRFAVVPEAVFVNPISNALLFVVTFAGGATTTDGFTGWARRFVDVFSADKPQGTVREEWLLLGDCPAVQLLIQDSVRVQFKFLLDAKVPVGLDFSVPRSAWEEEVRAVESSLGTIRKKQ
jgi:hypothetical protein